ncbi:hypothetical protein F5876DRAFT_69486 [Lentinula aff. lateritia]|uniref:Uncharacterized protein n=1 Tax=Lentinula aff. lateritia TaxID=2804960 RepID=A0ACC1TMF1_9AGAR|nr:hypothetical protein F5876DRAFT_69486 [Lentinula aff. lateritia]
MSHSQDLEAPTIFVEAPPEDEQGDLIDGGYTSLSLNSTFHEPSPELQALFLQMFPEASPSSMNVPGTSSASFDQSLFSAPFDQSSSTGQISPLITAGLREGSAGNVFLAPNDQSSPIDPAWSPASSFEGDGKVFSDGWSDGSSAWSPSVQSSSPSPSSPSLSPLNTSFNNIILSDDNVAGPALYRQRSNSFTRSTDSPNELGSRPRSSSFTDVASLAESSQYSSTTQSVIDDYTLFQHTSDYVEQISQIPQRSSSVQSDAASNLMGTSFDPRVLNSSFDETQWNMNQPVYSPPIGPPPSHSHVSHGRSLSTHLTVPSSLQRRDAHRRSHSHTGIQQDSIRGRKRFSPTGDLSSRHSSQSREPSPTSPYQQLDFTHAPYLNFGPTVQTQFNNSDSLTMLTSTSSPQSDFLSPTSTSSNSPQSPSSHVDFFSATTSPHSLLGAVDPFFSPGISSSSGSSQLSLPITIQGHDSEPELIPVQYSDGVARRHSFAGIRSPSGSRSASPLPESSSNASDSLHRAISDPIGQNRRRRAPTVPRRYPGLLKPAKEVDEAGTSYPDSSMMINVPIEGVHSAPAPAEFKTVVGSNKIVEASKARRKNEAKFKCDICAHCFTAKHNLQSVHISVRSVEIPSPLEELMLDMKPFALAGQFANDYRESNYRFIYSISWSLSTFSTSISILALSNS